IYKKYLDKLTNLKSSLINTLTTSLVSLTSVLTMNFNFRKAKPWAGRQHTNHRYVTKTIGNRFDEAMDDCAS
ncbi:MAG: hypothetical protein EBW54_09260, partial [Betaproteobacteria bacterium]|nr:hypothetical protein [Betaproteobacteria bacterium]